MPAETHIDSFPGDVEVTGGLSSTSTTGGVDAATVTEDSGTNSEFRIVFATGKTGRQTLKTHQGIKYNPSTGIIIGAVNQADASTNASHAQQATFAAHAGQVSQTTYAAYAPSAIASNHTYQGAAFVGQAGGAGNAGYTDTAHVNTGYGNYAQHAGYGQNSNHSYGAIYSNNWFRAQGTAGFYFQTYHGGWQMNNYSYQQTYNNRTLTGWQGWRVSGVEAYIDYWDHEHDWWENWTTIIADTGAKYYSMYVQYAVRSPGYSAVSDRRIKQDIEDLDDLEALETLRALKPCKYDYKNRPNKNKTIGFIAQEVMEVLPDAVGLTHDYVPNILSNAAITFTHTNFGSNLSVFNMKLATEPTEVNIKVGDELEMAVPTNMHMIANVITVYSSTDIDVVVPDAEDLLESGRYSNVFVRGTYINDFHVLDKDKIWAVGMAALQQIDREILEKESKITKLKSDISSTLSRIEVLESN